MDFIKKYMTDAGQVPKIEGEEVKLLFLGKIKSRAMTGTAQDSFHNCIQCLIEQEHLLI